MAFPNDLPVLKLHPDAIQRFNERVRRLVPLLSTTAPPRDPPSGSSRWPDALPPREIAPIGHVQIERRDLSGEHGTIARSYDDGTWLGLHGPNYVAFLEAVEAVFRAGNIPGLLTRSFVQERLLNWLEKGAKHSTGQQPDFCDYLESEAAGAVETLTALVPVYGLAVERAFPLGRVMIQPMPARLFHDWQSSVEASPSANTDKQALLQEFERLRQDHQGRAVVVFTGTASPDRIEELALEEARKSLGLLRLFDPGMFKLNAVASCVPFGGQHRAATRVLLLQKQRQLLPGLRNSLVPPFAGLWQASSGDIAEFLGVALGPYERLLRSPQPSPFESDVLSSIALYTEGGTRPAVADRLLYTFAALESLLLKDQHEPIAQNIGDRLAFALVADARQRQHLAALVKRTYDLRSRFVHHGESITNERLIEEFLQAVWKFYVIPLPRSLQHKTRIDFIDSLERIKYA